MSTKLNLISQSTDFVMGSWLNRAALLLANMPHLQPLRTTTMRHTPISRRNFNLTLTASLAAPFAAPSTAVAQSAGWPSKPVRWVVGYPPGGGSDFLARQLAAQIGKQLGDRKSVV